MVTVSTLINHWKTPACWSWSFLSTLVQIVTLFNRLIIAHCRVTYELAHWKITQNWRRRSLEMWWLHKILGISSSTNTCVSEWPGNRSVLLLPQKPRFVLESCAQEKYRTNSLTTDTWYSSSHIFSISTPSISLALGRAFRALLSLEMDI